MPVVQASTAANAAFAKKVEAAKRKDLRKQWSKTKTDLLAKMAEDKDYKDDAKELQKKFNQGLGPTLDKWAIEVNKWPVWDTKKLFAIRTEAQHIMAGYIDAVTKSEAPAKIKMDLNNMLRVLDAAMKAQFTDLDLK